VQGRIAKVGTVITTAGAAPDEGSAPASTSAAASDARVEVTVTIANQKRLGSLDAAPVDVDFVANRRANVLAVPVVALLALTRGGFGVQVVDEATTRIVPVKTGMFAAGQVEISGKGVAAGMRVGVPK
jgi:multidrug efflux pump subunit AcrA (membrane-fusion protein)